MAIMVYTGVMGSGKTYEAVSTAALTALRAGRRVVTNIAGFNYQAIRDHLDLLRDGSPLEEDKVLVITSKRIIEPYFFFDPDVSSESVVKPGDLVLIDEVWAFWGTDCKLREEHQKFFRMHRHYTEANSGLSCDLVVMIQDLLSLHRGIRGVIESNFKFTKMKTLGLQSRYRVEVYEGNKQRKANLVSVTVKKYDKSIFPLYKSYDGIGGREAIVDDRQNLLKNKWFVGVMLCAFAGLFGSMYWFVGYVGRLKSGGAASTATKPNAAASSVAQRSAAVLPGAVGLQSAARSDLRLVGVLERPNGETLVLVQGVDGRITQQRMDAGMVDGWRTLAGHEGRMVGFVFGRGAK